MSPQTMKLSTTSSLCCCYVCSGLYNDKEFVKGKDTMPDNEYEKDEYKEEQEGNCIEKYLEIY